MELKFSVTHPHIINLKNCFKSVQSEKLIILDVSMNK